MKKISKISENFYCKPSKIASLIGCNKNSNIFEKNKKTEYRKKKARGRKI